jgi:ComF family protein
MQILSELAELFFPRLCIACSNPLFTHESNLCDLCLFHLPRTNFEKDMNNPVAQLFWGRVNIELATSFFFYSKGSRYQHILHDLKYKGKKEIGFEIGKIFGKEILPSGFSQIQLIVPIPLHPSRQRKRGYNQSEWIAMGLAEAMGKPMESKSLSRISASSTQTKKGRYDRWTNVEGIFRANVPGNLANRHVLLVDDVVTTGATLEACATEVLSIPNTKVSIATLAVA